MNARKGFTVSESMDDLVISFHMEMRYWWDEEIDIEFYKEIELQGSSISYGYADCE